MGSGLYCQAGVSAVVCSSLWSLHEQYKNTHSYPLFKETMEGTENFTNHNSKNSGATDFACEWDQDCTVKPMCRLSFVVHYGHYMSSTRTTSD